MVTDTVRPLLLTRSTASRWRRWARPRLRPLRWGPTDWSS